MLKVSSRALEFYQIGSWQFDVCLIHSAVYEIPRSFGIIIKPLGAFQELKPTINNKDGGWPSAAPPWLVWFGWLWL